MTELTSEQQLRENAVIKSSAAEAYKGIVKKDDIDFDIKRDWSPKHLPRNELPDFIKYDPVLFQFFKRLHYEDKNFIAVVVGETGAGKTMIGKELVKMADGSWKRHDEIIIGDKIISPNYKTNKNDIGTVIEVHKRFSKSNFSVINKRTNEILYTCADNHDIPFVYRYIPHTIENGKNVRKSINTKIELRCREAKDLFKLSDFAMHGRPTKQGVFIENYLNQQDSSINPYLLGVILGDGHIRKNNQIIITSANTEIIDVLKTITDYCSIRKKQNHFNFSISSKSKISNEINRVGLTHKLSGDKFIPNECLKSSSNYRYLLLAGLIDTDGYINKQGKIEITLKSKQLINDIIELVHSLGGKAKIRSCKKKCCNNGKIGQYWATSINLGRDNIFIPLIHKEKKKRILNRHHSNKYHDDPTNVLFKLKPAPANWVYGFEIDSPSHLYITSNFCITHNSCSAINLARNIDITPLGNGRFKRNFIIKADAHGKPTPECRIVFGPSDFLRLIKSGLPKGSCIIWDEAGIGQDAVSWQDKKSRLIKHVMQTFRSRNYGLFLTVPDKESITLATRRLVHCYVDVQKRDAVHATLDVRWLNRVRGNEKTTTYYKYPVFKDPVSGKLKKIVKYKVPRLPTDIENEYNKVKNTTLQNMYEYYQKEMEFMEKELGEKSINGPDTAIKMKKFNMAACTEMAKNNIDTLQNDDTSFSEAKIMLSLSKNGYDCNKAQAKLVGEMMKEYKSLGIV